MCWKLEMLLPITKLRDPPTNFTVQYITYNYITLSWQPPTSTNETGAITLYTLTYTRIEGSNSDVQPMGYVLRRTRSLASNYSINTTSTCVNLTNLTSSSTYMAWVSAWTSVGQGPTTLPITFHTDGAAGNGSCLSCSLNMTVDVTNPSRKCFAVIVSWLLHRAARSNVRVIYYNLTLLSIGGVIAFNKELDDANVTAFKISSDSLDSNTNYVVILEARLLLHDESQYSLQSNFSIKTPSCTGVTTVVAVVTSSVCTVLVLILVGVVLLIFQKCGCFKRKNTNHNHPPTHMSRRFVVNNDYLTQMKQQRGDGRSTNTGSSLTNSSTQVSPNPSLVDEDELGLESETDPLLHPLSQESPVFFVPPCSHGIPPPHTPSLSSSSSKLEDVVHSIVDRTDGYIANDSFPVLVKPLDSRCVPDRPGPEGSSLSSVSMDSSDDTHY